MDNLFQFIKLIFGYNTDYDIAKSHHKKKHFFMVNRFMAIQNPLHANNFNHLYIDQSTAVDMWRSYGKRFSKVPGWIYTKTARSKSNKVKEPDSSISAETIKFFKDKFMLSERDYKELLTHVNSKEVIKYLKGLEKSIKTVD